MNWYVELEKELRPEVPEERKSQDMESKYIFSYPLEKDGLKGEKEYHWLNFARQARSGFFLWSFWRLSIVQAEDPVVSCTSCVLLVNFNFQNLSFHFTKWVNKESLPQRAFMRTQ